VNATGEGEVETAISQIKQGKTPTPLTASGFLTASAIAQVQSTIAAYNSAISQEVTAVGGILVDIHSYFQTLQSSGITINNYKATPAFLGGLFSLDGVHPTNTGYALIANQFIDAINSSANTNIAQVNVSVVAAADPLFGLNVTPGEAVGIPLIAARRTDALIKASESRSLR
jgi:hypothetical protein